MHDYLAFLTQLLVFPQYTYQEVKPHKIQLLFLILWMKYESVTIYWKVLSCGTIYHAEHRATVDEIHLEFTDCARPRALGNSAQA